MNGITLLKIKLTDISSFLKKLPNSWKNNKLGMTFGFKWTLLGELPYSTVIWQKFLDMH